MAEVTREFSGDALLCVTSEDGSSKGWRVDLLVEKLSEGKLLLCSCCNGLLRDACLCEEELRCEVCIPEGVTSQPVKMNRTIVNEKMIYCPLKWRGCGWSDRVSAAVHHLEDCLYLPVACPLGCVSLEGDQKGEVVKIEMRHIVGHVRDSCPLRILVCEFCGGEVKASEMNPHLEDCEEFLLPCPNGCSREGEEGKRELKRKDIPVHLDNDCSLQRVRCPYWDHGCREEMERRHTDTHKREFLHIHFKLSTKLLTQKMMTMSKELVEVKEKSSGKIEILEEQMAGKDLSLLEMKQKQSESTQRLQQELDIANEKIAVQELTAQKQISKVQEQVDDKTAQIESLSQVLFFQVPIGNLKWNVNGVKQKIENKERTFSDPFYVGLYKCQSCIDWNCKDTGNVGVYIYIMKGDFDAKLHWPIRYKFTFVLTNQINSEDNLVTSDEVTKQDSEKFPNSFWRPTECKNNGFGYDSFISNTRILEEKYCKQDSIILHVSVELLSPLKQY